MGKSSSSERQLRPNQGLNLHHQADPMLMALDFRWPNAFLLSAFRQAYADLAAALKKGSAKQWPEILTIFLRQWLCDRLLKVANDDQDAVKWVLRETSALGAMLMHLLATMGPNGLHLVNERRHRTEYGTYPTSPRVAEAAARYVWNKLASKREQLSGPPRILDPTVEGGPLLLEMAFLISAYAVSKNSRRHKRACDFILSGVDQNPISASIVSTLLEAWRLRSSIDCLGVEIRCHDAFDALSDSKPLDAILNNPPWGARTDGATSERLSPYGPYIGYRDPYIALISLGISRLKPGGPFAFVLPFQLLTAASAGKLRQEILENTQLDHLILLPRKAFPRATVKTVMVLGCRRRDGERRRGMQVVTYPMECRLSDRSFPAAAKFDRKAVGSLGSAPWMTIIQSDPPFAPTAQVRYLGNIAEILLGIEPYRVGRGRPKQTHHDLVLRAFTFHRFRRGTIPVARSRDLARFRVGQISQFIQFGPWLAAPARQLEFAYHPRVFVRQICGRDGSLVAAVAPLGTVARYGVFTIVCNEICPNILCALLNSKIVAQFVRLHCAGYHKESFGRITVGDLRRLPIPKALLKRGEGAAGKALRTKLASAATRANSAAAAEDDKALSRTTATINSLIELAFGWSTPIIPSVANAVKSWGRNMQSLSKGRRVPNGMDAPYDG
jgi:hypothetical protein